MEWVLGHMDDPGFNDPIPPPEVNATPQQGSSSNNAAAAAADPVKVKEISFGKPCNPPSA
jgi:hypothetical protein